VSSKVNPSAVDTRVDFRLIRSVMETPILDERKWAKLPGIPADAFIIDLEDSVVPHLKETARERAVAALKDADFFGDRLVLARPNNISTPWGREDIVAFAEAGVQLMLYPKASSAAELLEVRELLRLHGADPLLFPIIESAGAVLDVLEISRVPGLGGMFTGIGDLSVDAGIPFYGADGEISPALNRARDNVVLAAAAAGASSTDTVYARNIRDTDDVLRAIGDSKRRGFTSLVTFYPPHVELINENMTPSAADIADAQMVVATYEVAQTAGNPAVVLEGGRTILLLDYTRAQRVLARAAAPVPTMRSI
jgi:citrate lyase beta subunit